MRTYHDIDPGLHPDELADCIEDLANEYLLASEEDAGRGKDDVAKTCKRVSDKLRKTAEQLRRISR